MELIPIGYPSSVTLFIVCGIALLAFIKYNFGKNLKESFLSFFNYRQSLRMLEERRESDRQAAILSNIFFSLIVGIFISLLFPFFGENPLFGNYATSILFFSAAVGLIFLIKSFIWKLLGAVFMVQNFSKIYIYNMFLYNRIIGLIIFPAVAIMPYIAATVTPFIVFAVIAISYLLKIWRIFQIINDQNVSFFYFILYLCTLEILPLLLLIKCCKILSESMIV